MSQHFLIIRLSAVIVLVVVTVLALGCGDSGDSGATANSAGEVTVKTGSLPKAQFIKQADAACRKVQRQILAAASEFAQRGKSSPESAQTEDLVSSVVIPAYEDEIDEISLLGVPKGDEAEVSAFLNAVQQDLEKSEREPLYATKPEKFFAKPSKLARAYGFKVCSGEEG